LPKRVRGGDPPLLLCAVETSSKYCIQLWSPLFWGDLVLLQSMQKKATKMTQEMEHLHCEDRLRKLK